MSLILEKLVQKNTLEYEFNKLKISHLNRITFLFRIIINYYYKFK